MAGELNIALYYYQFLTDQLLQSRRLLANIPKLVAIMELTYKLALRLMAPLTLEEVCKRCIEEGCKFFDAKYGSVFWYDNGKLKRIYSNAPKAHQFEPRPNGNMLEVFSSRKPKFLSSNVMEKNHPSFKKLPINSINLIPLSYAHKSLGVLSLQSVHQNDYLSKKKQKVLLFSSLVSLAIRNVQLYEQKQEALNQRDLFMSLASHELKTPLAVVIMTLHLIDRKYQPGGKFDERWLETIKRNTNKLKLLIDDLFSVSQIHAGTIIVRPSLFSVVDVCEKIADDLASIHDRTIKIINKLTPVRERILADEEKISLVLTNVLNNALKFSSAETDITLTLNQKWSGVEIRIKDKGVGIDELDQAQVFERFFQGKNRGNGLGLGLFLSREIIEAHEGEIKLRSKVGKGTTVIIWLPGSDNE